MSLSEIENKKQYKNAEDFDAHYFDDIARRSNIFACIQCGSCTASCESGRWTALKTRQIVRKVILGDLSAINDPDIWLCTTCYQCYERCPRDVRPTDVIIELRNYAAKLGNISPAHRKVIEFLKTAGHGVPINDAVKKQRQELGMEPTPPTIYKYKDAPDKELDKIANNLFNVPKNAENPLDKKDKKKEEKK